MRSLSRKWVIVLRDYRKRQMVRLVRRRLGWACGEKGLVALSTTLGTLSDAEVFAGLFVAGFEVKRDGQFFC